MLSSQLREDVGTQIIPLLRQLEPQYTADGYATIIAEAFAKLRDSYANVNTNAQRVANQFVSSANDANKKRFYSAISDSIGVNLQSIIQNENLENTLIATTSQNVSLIKSIPEQYLKNIESIVYSGLAQKNKATSMTQQIMQAGGVTRNRAKFIARDQSSKFNGALTKQRATNLGVEEYVWRTAEDDRVRDTHRVKNGKTFRFDTPPKDTGNPGQDYNCRCVAQPIIKI